MKLKYWLIIGFCFLLVGVFAYSILTNPYSLTITEIPPIKLPAIVIP